MSETTSHPTDAESPAPKRRRSRSRRGLWLLLGIALVAGGELTVRVLGLVDVRAGIATPEQAEFYAALMFESVSDERGYHNRPDASCVVGPIDYVHDGRGWRTADELAPPSAELSAVFLGDSTTYGLGVTGEQALPAQTAAFAQHVGRSLNLGVSGYTTLQEAHQYAAAREHLGDDAGLVVLVFYPNDAVLHDLRWDRGTAILYADVSPAPELLKPLLWRSALYRGFVSWHARGAIERGELAMRLGNMPRVERGLRQLAEAVAADGRQLVVTHLPGMIDLDPYVAGDVVASLAASCAELDLPFIDLLPAFLEERDREIDEYEARTGQTVDALVRRTYLSRFWVDPKGRDRHLSAAATQLAARALASALDDLLAP
jgi:lysophospholipase L1-like esterase